jgi:hypothetical protein
MQFRFPVLPFSFVSVFLPIGHHASCYRLTLVTDIPLREQEYNVGIDTESQNGVQTTVAEDAVRPEVVIRTSDSGGRWWTQHEVITCPVIIFSLEFGASFFIA